jgi:hypothetical protein
VHYSTITLNRCKTTTHASDFDAELFRAECAIDEDDPVVITHFGPLFFGKARKHIAIMRYRATATARDR